MDNQEVYSVQAHLSLDRESIVIEILPEAKSRKAHVWIFPVKDFEEDEDSVGAKENDIKEITDGKDSIYRVPIEIGRLKFHSDTDR